MKKIFTGVLIAMAGVVLAACGNGKSSESSTPKESNDTFTYAINGDPSSMNPINVSDRWGLTATNMIYSPLARIEGDGTQKLELAEAIEPAADGKSITVKLKKDIKWSDGEAFTADDVVFTYSQKVKKENGNADSLWVDGKPISVKKIDDTTVEFDLPSVSAAALNNIATETYIIPEHIFKDEKDFAASTLAAKPVGTGPYVLKEYKTGQYLQFVANENYYGGTPEIKNITLRIITSADTTKVALQKGEVDASFILPNDIEDLDTDTTDVYEYSENRVGYLGFNTNSDNLKDVKVRQAIQYALNRDDLNKAAYLDEKYYQNVQSILPPNNPYATTDVNDYKTDVDKSKELLKEAGVSDLTINLAFSSSDPAQTVQATLIQQQLEKVGITVELAGGDSAAYGAELKKPGSKKYDLFMNGYIMGNDPDLYSYLFASTGSANYFQYKSDATDELFRQGSVEMDDTKRKEIYVKLQQQIADDAVIYPIVDNKKVLAVNSRVQNIKEAGLIPIYTLEDMSKLTLK
ncbi:MULTISPECIES: ABC transporter substrate-binding protein [Enterococcus]|uniref:ABC transporter substrate-binding protein n=1 Tax=Enterococcus TaxID=1350 RepID=UPI0010F86EF7|nr:MULTISPECIES: ABC transporter substrate-binding protein [Enterococcus]KAF1301750.1 peptide ABC transporter substrate-binding protein [Enterococcus sp. JM9B]